MAKGKTVNGLIHSFRLSRTTSKQVSMDVLLHHIEREMKKGADLNFSDKVGNTPFFYAISLKNEELLRHLLQYEFSMDHRNALGQTALSAALKHGIPEPVCCVMANRLKYPNIPDNANMTPFVWALNVGYFKVMDILRNKGAMDYVTWIRECCSKDQEVAVCDVIRDHGIAFSAKLDEQLGRTLLHYAVLYKAVKTVTVLLQHRYVHPDIVDENGWTALHYAAAKNYWEIAQILIGFDAAFLLKTEEEGYMPIDVARKFRSEDVVAVLEELERERRESSMTMAMSSNSSGSGRSGHSAVCSSPSRTNTITVRPRGRSNMLSVDSSTSDDTKYDDDDYRDQIGWNKENQDCNAMASRNGNGRRPTAVDAGNGALSKPRFSASESSSNTRSQSENVNASTSNSSSTGNKPRWKGPNVSLIVEEREFVKRIEDEYEDGDGRVSGHYDAYSDSEESNQTRIIHSSFESSGSYAASITNTPREQRTKDGPWHSEEEGESDGFGEFDVDQIERGIIGSVQ